MLTSVLAAVLAGLGTPYYCTVYNSTDGAIDFVSIATGKKFGGLKAHDSTDAMHGVFYDSDHEDPGEVHGFNVTSGKETVKVACESSGPYAVVRKDGKLGVVALPDWFKAGSEEGPPDEPTELTVHAPAGTEVLIDGTKVVSTGEASLGYDVDKLIKLPLVDADHTAHVQIPSSGIDVWAQGNLLRPLGRALAAARGTPLAWAAPLAPSGPHPALVVSCSSDSGTEQCGAGDAVAAANGLARPEQAQLVAYKVPGYAVVEKCPSGSERRTRKALFNVFEARTGKKVAQREFEGGQPPPCSKKSARLMGTAPPADAIDAWLKTL